MHLIPDGHDEIPTFALYHPLLLLGLKAPTSTFTSKTLLRHYANLTLTPRKVDVKLGRRHNYHKGSMTIYYYADKPFLPYDLGVPFSCLFTVTQAVKNYKAPIYIQSVWFSVSAYLRFSFWYIHRHWRNDIMINV